MARTAAVTQDLIRSTVLAMLAEAHDHQPASRERFRRVVSVRKLRDRLGAGDPATLGRAINAIESELVRSGLAEIAMPAIPDEIAEQMRQLWHAAVAVQLDDIVKLKTESRKEADVAQAALVESTLRVEILKQELSELRAAAAVRDTELAQLRAEHAALSASLGDIQAQRVTWQDELQVALARSAALEQEHALALAAAQQRYEGLSKQLLQETAQQRQTHQSENTRLASQLKFAERRIATLEKTVSETEAELAKEREQRHKIAGEASAFKAINASQRGQIDELVRAAMTTPPAPKQRAAAKPAVAAPAPGASKDTPSAS